MNPKIFFLPIFIFLIIFFTSCSSPKSLFNGKNLHGWQMDVPELDKNPGAVRPFLVREGMLVSLGTPNGHLISEKEYENYRLEVEYRFAGSPGNCGVLVHASTPPCTL